VREPFAQLDRVVSESDSESDSESVSESDSESVSESDSESVSESDSESVSESDNESVSENVSGFAADKHCSGAGPRPRSDLIRRFKGIEMVVGFERGAGMM